MAQIWVVITALISIPDDLYKALEAEENTGAYKNLESILKANLNAQDIEVSDIWDPI